MPKPDFIIIGAQKCGTTSLWHYLKSHPQIRMAPTKELHYFDRMYSRVKPQWYMNQFKVPDRKRFKALEFVTEYNEPLHIMKGEATPLYLYHPKVPNRVKKHLPNCKFITLLRNPVDRAWSHYKMLKHRRVKIPFEKVVDQSISDTSLYDGILGRGIYIDQLQRWFEHFNREQFLIIKTEEMNVNTEAAIQNSEEFLGVIKRSRPNKKFVKHFESRPSTIPESCKSKLIEFYKSYNKQLNDLIGINFNA